MKLALAIVLCICLYLCAVSASPPDISTDDGDLQSGWFFENHEGYKMFLDNCLKFEGFIAEGAEKFLIKYPAYKTLLDNYVGHDRYFIKNRLYKMLLNIYQGYPKFLENCAKYRKFIKNCKGIGNFFKQGDLQYMWFTQNYEADKNYDELFIESEEQKEFLENFIGQKDCEGCENFFEKDPAYEMFLVNVNHKYTNFVAIVSNGTLFDNLKLANLNFKLGCVKQFKNKLEHATADIEKCAYETLSWQKYFFIHDLKESGIDKQMKESLNGLLSQEGEFLRFFGLWFKPQLNEVALKKAIVETKANKGLKDKAARVEVIWLMYKCDAKYISQPPVHSNLSESSAPTA